MNKYNFFAILGVLLLSSASFAARVTMPDDGVDPRALTAVESYLDALVNGDIFAMQDLLSPSLMEKKAPVFESSSSGSMLRARYKNAHSRIVGANTMGDNRVKVDAQIAFESGRSMGVSFVLVNDGNGDYLIDEEVE